ncbi:MAG: hypothetical protein K0S32_1068 [Bacteroidetes bacterium]|nr:hypothetical protein [Bacteroidota bacterium]
MKTQILSILLLGSVLSFNAQTSQSRSVGAYNKIIVTDAVNVFYTSSDSLEAKVNGNENEIQNVELKVENSTLIISAKGKFYNPVNVYLKNNRLTEVFCSGASEFRTRGLVKADTILFSISGASHAHATIESKNVSVKEAGASELILKGSTDLLNAEISGAAVMKAYDLIAKNANVTTSGASTAKLFIVEKLTAGASGASNIKVKGEAKDISAETSGAASITRIIEEKKYNGKDSTSFEWKGRKIIVIGGDKDNRTHDTTIHIGKYRYSSAFQHWTGFSVGVNGLLTPGGAFNQPNKYNYLDLNYSRCINFQLNIFQHNFHIYKNYVNVVTGFGLEWRRYMLDNKVTLDPDSSFTHGVIDSSNTFAYNKNLFKSTMIQVPLLLEFNTHRKNSKSFHIAVGAIGQFMINSKTKQILELKGDEYTKIRKDNYNMSPFQVKAHASIGYSDFTVFGEYNITPLFESGKGAEVYPFVVGVRLVPFTD